MYLSRPGHRMRGHEDSASRLSTIFCTLCHVILFNASGSTCAVKPTAPRTGREPAESDALVLHNATSAAAASSVQDVNTITLDTAGWRRVLTSIARLCVTIPLCAFASVQTPPDTQPSSIVLPACPELKQGKRKKESLFSRHIRCLFRRRARATTHLVQQAATLCTQVVGQPHRRSARVTVNDVGQPRRSRPRASTPLSASMSTSLLLRCSLTCLSVSPLMLLLLHGAEAAVTSNSPPPFVSLRGPLLQTNVLSP